MGQLEGGFNKMFLSAEDLNSVLEDSWQHQEVFFIRERNKYKWNARLSQQTVLWNETRIGNLEIRGVLNILN